MGVLEQILGEMWVCGSGSAAPSCVSAKFDVDSSESWLTYRNVGWRFFGRVPGEDLLRRSSPSPGHDSGPGLEKFLEIRAQMHSGKAFF